MKNKKMKPDNNNLDAIAKQARQLPKAGMGLNYIGNKFIDNRINTAAGGLMEGAGFEKSAKTQKLEKKATSGLGIFKPFASIRYKNNLAKDYLSGSMQNIGKELSGIGQDPMGYASNKTGIPKEDMTKLAMKAGMAAAGVPPIGFKKGGSVKKKKK